VATAVQLGTVDFYHPTISMQILDTLPDAIASLESSAVRDVVGTLRTKPKPQPAGAPK